MCIRDSGKILRQPALCGKPLLGFRFRILPGLFGVGTVSVSYTHLGLFQRITVLVEDRR